MFMKEFILSRFKGDLAFIENTENYYAAFDYVIDKCATAQLENSLLYMEEAISNAEYNANFDRIHKAHKLAITTHGEWVIKTLEQSKTPHTPRTLVSSIYSDIWGIELKSNTMESVKP